MKATFSAWVFVILSFFSADYLFSQQAALWDFETDLTTTSVDVNASTGGVTINSLSSTSIGGNGGGSAYGFIGYTTSALIDLNDYIEFSITPNSGYELNLFSVSFDEQQGNGTSPANWAIRSSVDGYIANLSATSTSGSWTTQTISLSSHTGLTSETTFRIYGYNSGSDVTGEWDIDNITIYGSIDPSGVITYDFGTGTGTHSGSNVVSVTFLPQPTSGNDRVRTGSQGGQIVLDNPGLSGFGSGSELYANAATNTSYNFVQVYDFTGGNTFYIQFLLRLENGSNGYWYFVAGDGANFSNSSGISSAQTFLGISWEYGSSNSIITRTYNNTPGWVVDNLSGTPFSQNLTYNVQIFGNNSSTSVSYRYSGGSTTVAAQKYDLYVNGTQVGDDVTNSGLTSGNNIDSWMFYGGSSTLPSNNSARLYLENIHWLNGFGGAVLPVTYMSFEAEAIGQSVALQWATSTESNNDYFALERSIDGEHFEEIGIVQGNGNSNEIINYSFLDKAPFNGTNYYRLKQVDFDGQYAYSTIVDAKITGNIFSVFELFPNPTEGSVHIHANLESGETASYTITDLNGKIWKEGNFKEILNGHTLVLSTEDMPAGVYLVSLQSKSFQTVKKLIIQ